MVRILFVDDYPGLAESFVFVFQIYGFDARALTDGTQTLKIVAEFRPHFVVLDLRMPNCDGAHIARDLLALTDRPKILIVSASAERREELVRLGVDLFLVKPTEPLTLLQFVQSLAA